MGARVFEKDLIKANGWLKELSDELGVSPDDAYKILRGVLHEFRDRLPIEVAVHFAAQFPTLLKGVFYENWKISDKPIKYSKEEFVNRVNSYFGILNINSEDAIKKVFGFFSKKISSGEIDDVMSVLPKEMKTLFEG